MGRLLGWARRNAVTLDITLASVSVAVIILWHFNTGSADLVGFLLSITAVGMLAARRVWAEIVGVVVAVLGVAAIVFSHMGQPAVPVMAAAMIALYSMAAYGSRRGLWASLGIALVGAAVATVDADALDNVMETATTAGLFGASVVGVWALGVLRRVTREEQIARAARAADAERARIAREMHDIIAHSLAVVITQADAGRYAATAEGAEGSKAAVALDTIASTGRQALGDIRSVLGVLHDVPDSGERYDITPLPGVDDIPELLDTFRAQGVAISHSVTGQQIPLPPAIELTVYRIMQEALTNTLKHVGPGATVQTTLVWGPEVEISIVDHGERSVSPLNGSGNGLTGMQERARLHGGTVETGLTADGFSVRARIPVGVSA